MSSAASVCRAILSQRCACGSIRLIAYVNVDDWHTHPGGDERQTFESFRVGNPLPKVHLVYTTQRHADRHEFTAGFIGRARLHHSAG